MVIGLQTGVDPETEQSATVPDLHNRKVVLILSAARKLFLEQGFDAITMDMVARQATVSKATLYAHFSSKEDLFTTVIVEETRRAAEELWTIAADEDDVVSVLRHVAQNFFDIFLTERAIFFRRAVIGAIPRFPSIGRAIFESGPKATTERLAQFLTSADERRILRVPNATLAATQFLSIVKGDIDIRGLLSLDLPSRADIDAQIEAGIELFLRFYMPGASGLPVKARRSRSAA